MSGGAAPAVHRGFRALSCRASRHRHRRLAAGGWIWAAIVVLVAIIVLMYALASRYYGRVREAVGMRSYLTPKNAPDPTPASPEQLAALVDSRRPDLIGLVGIVGLLILLWLMYFKPF